MIVLGSLSEILTNPFVRAIFPLAQAIDPNKHNQ